MENINAEDDDEWVEPDEPSPVIFAGPMFRTPMREIWGDEIKIGDVIVPGCEWGDNPRHYSFDEIEKGLSADGSKWHEVYAIVHVSEPCDCPSYLDELNWPYLCGADTERQAPRRGWHRHLLARSVAGWHDVPHKGQYCPVIYENSAEAMVRRTDDQWRIQQVYFLLGRFPLKEVSTIKQLGLF